MSKKNPTRKPYKTRPSRPRYDAGLPSRYAGDYFANADLEEKLIPNRLYRVKIKASPRASIAIVSNLGGIWVTTIPYDPEEWDLSRGDGALI